MFPASAEISLTTSLFDKYFSALTEFNTLEYLRDYILIGWLFAKERVSIP